MPVPEAFAYCAPARLQWPEPLWQHFEVLRVIAPISDYGIPTNPGVLSSACHLVASLAHHHRAAVIFDR